MSTLNNQLENKSLQVLKDLVCRPDRRLAEADAHELGLDTNILETIYEMDVKPYLDFIIGYKDLAKLDPQGEHYRDMYRWSDGDGWDGVLRRHGLVSEYPQVVEVLQARLYTITQNHDLLLDIFLSRKGQWIVWHKRSSRQQNDALGGESIATFKTIVDLCKFLGELVTNDYKFEYQYSGTALPKYIPIRIARGLMGLIESTITKRQEYLASFQSAHEDGNNRLGLIELKDR